MLYGLYDLYDLHDLNGLYDLYDLHNLNGLYDLYDLYDIRRYMSNVVSIILTADNFFCLSFLVLPLLIHTILFHSCGQDYGWSTFEGSRCQEAQQDRIGSCDGISRSGVTFPIYEYCHPDYDSTDEGEDVFTNGNDLCGARSVTGLAVIGKGANRTFITIFFSCRLSSGLAAGSYFFL